jgi:beta-glucoside PTS system EIICBA component
MNEEFGALSRDIMGMVGGAGNVISVSHCATRLRFRLRDGSKPDRAGLTRRPGVLSIVESNAQFQIVIGPKVPELFEAISALLPADNAAPAKVSPGENTETKPSLKERSLAFIQSIVSPVVPALAGAGMVKALLLVLGTAGLGWLDPAASTYRILMAASNSTFYFLPLLFAVSTARALNVPIINALIIVGALMEPNFTGLMKAPGDIVRFLGMPVVMMGYASTIVPAVVTVLVYRVLYTWLEKRVPASLSLFVVPMLSLVIMVPLAAMVIGPFGVYVASGLAKLVIFLNGTSGLILGALIGAGWTYLVILGVHASVVPIMMNNFATLGYDTIRPPVACATFAQGGAAFGVFLRARNKKTKAFALSCIVPMMLGGITEPIIYGLSIRYKRPLIAATIGGCISGAFMGAMTVKAMAYIFPSLITLPAFFGETFVYYLIGISMSFVITTVLTFILGFEEEDVSGAA